MARIKTRVPPNKQISRPNDYEPTSKDLIDGDRVFALQALDK
jgi:hypothetical protein